MGRDQLDEVGQRSGRNVRLFLDENGFRVDRVETLRNADYFAFLFLSHDLKTRLGLSGDELLLLVLHQQNQQQWFLSEIRNYLRKWERLSKTAVLVLSADPRIATLCKSAYADSTTGYKTAHVALTRQQIEAAQSAADRKTLLLDVFRAQAFSIDHFDTRSPVPDDLFGRTQTVAQIEADVRSSREGVAILGVRRAGKTSVLKRVLSQLRNDPEQQRSIGYYDAQQHSVDANSETASTRLVQTLRESAKDMGIELQAPSPDRTPTDNLRATVQHLVETKGRSLVLAIDEIEWLIPTAHDAEPDNRAKDYVRLFGLLRSLKQEYGERLGLLLCGINETFCELPEIQRYPNPSLDWYRVHYISLLTREDAAQMLRELGHRMGLDLSVDFLNETWKAFAGHPYLVRQFCSEVAAKTATRPYELGVSDFSGAYAPFMERAVNAFKAILEHLARFYPDEYRYLAASVLNPGPPASTNVARHLRAYGILATRPDGTDAITMAALAEYVTRHTIEDVRRERFKMLRRLGQGVTGTVWQAWDNDNARMCAIKLYGSDASDPFVRKEFMMLKALECPFVPAAFEVARIDDQSALVMEFMPGSSLHDVLKQRGKLPALELQTLARNLFDALTAIHPNVDRINALRLQFANESQVSADDWDELQGLLAGGFLHRDIKPANIVVSGGVDWIVRLVDVQLAAPAGDARLTRVGTPAYLPPDWGVAKWDVTFDLYGLGCILFECAFGHLPGEAYPAEIEAAISDAQYRGATLSFFSKALAVTASERYQSVQAMRNDWEGAVVAFV